MDNIAPSSASRPDLPTPTAVNTASQAQREVPSKPSVKLEQPAEPEVSTAEVAAEAKEGKVKSLSTLASISESMDEAVEVLNDALRRKHTSAQIRRDEQLNRFLITIKDKESGEVVREIPAEALLKFARNLEELKGILFDETL